MRMISIKLGVLAIINRHDEKKQRRRSAFKAFKACLHGGRGLQVGGVTRLSI